MTLDYSWIILCDQISQEALLRIYTADHGVQNADYRLCGSKRSFFLQTTISQFQRGQAC